MLELSAMARSTAHWRVTRVCFPHWVAIARWDKRPKREAIYRRLKLLQVLFRVMRMILTRFSRLLSGIRRLRHSQLCAAVEADSVRVFVN